MTPAFPIAKYGLDSCSRKPRAPMARAFDFFMSKIMSAFRSEHSNRLVRVACFILCAALPGAAQTRVDQPTQIKGAVKNGTTLPAVCALGEVFFKSNAPAGSNLYGCTSTNTWTQMSGSVSSGGGTLGGDVTGNSASATVVAIRNRSISAATPSNGQVLGWNSSTNIWEPQTPASPGGGGGGGGGVQVPFQTTFVSGSVLSVGTGCNAGNLCLARFGNTSYQFASAATATISAGTGTAYVYLSPNGSLTVGHTMTVSCAGCTAIGGVTSFPVDSIPLYTWNANTNGQWDANGGIDWRSMISTKNVTAGVGLVEIGVGGATTLSVDTAAVGLRVAVPANSAITCTAGAWAADASFLYVCYANDSWRRVAVAAW